MSLVHYIRREIQVRVGGRKFGPLHFGGEFYTVFPVTAWRYYALRSAIASSSDSDSTISDFIPSALSEGLANAQNLCRMFLKEELSKKDMSTASLKQLETIWAAACVCNDWSYIEGKKGGGGRAMTLGMLGILASEAAHGSISPREAMFEMPYQELLAILEDSAAIETMRNEKPDSLTDADFEWFKDNHPELELE